MKWVADIKRLEREVDRSAPTSAEVKKTKISPNVLMA
jgi:hypothetical protein